MGWGNSLVCCISRMMKQHSNHSSVCFSSASWNYFHAHLSSLPLISSQLVVQHTWNVMLYKLYMNTLECKCVETCPVFWQSDSFVHLSQALPSIVLCQPPNTPPSWIALAYITAIYAHQSVSHSVYVCPTFFLEVLFQEERVRHLWANMYTTPAYLRCLAGLIITVHYKLIHISMRLLNKSQGSPALSCATQPGSTTWIDENTLY